MEIDKNELLEALSRSGYLLESEIAKRLSELNLFVATNQAILDPLTGKSREIDIVAEVVEFREFKSHEQIISAAAITTLVLEIKNSSSPLVLLTEMGLSPRIDNNILKTGLVCPKGIDFDRFLGFPQQLIGRDESKIFTQYCCFSPKKSSGKTEELMAHHPDNIYSALAKITQYCEEIIWEEENSETSLFRLSLNLPVLLINDGLFELGVSDDGHNTLNQVDCSRMVFNYFYNQRPKSSLIYVVTKKGLPAFIDKMKKINNSVIQNLHA